MYTKGVFGNSQDIEVSNNQYRTTTEINKLVNCLEISHTKSGTVNQATFGGAIFSLPIDVSTYKKITIQYDLVSFAGHSESVFAVLATNKSDIRDRYESTPKYIKTTYFNQNVGSGYVATIDVSDLSGMYYLGIVHNSYNSGNQYVSVRINSVTLSV